MPSRRPAKTTRRTSRRGRAPVARNRRTRPKTANRRLAKVADSKASGAAPKRRGKGPSGEGRAGALLRSLRHLGKRLGKPLAIGLLVGAVVTGGVMAHRFVVQSPHFHVQRVEVSPTVQVTAGEVRRLAKIGPRTNIFTIDLDQVAARVERHPWIAKAKVHRRMPDAIRIQVTEHQAAAAVLVQGSRAVETRFYLVTAQGQVFKRAAHTELVGLPLISGIDRTEYLQRKRSTRERVRRAVAVYRRYAKRPGRPRVGELHVDEVEGVTFYTAQRAVQVRFGRGDIAAKLRRYDRVLAELARRGQRAAAIRLDNERHPAQVTVRLAEAQVSNPGAR